MSRSPVLTIVLAALCGAGAAGLALTKPKPPPADENVFKTRHPNDLHRFLRTMPGEPDLEIVQQRGPGRIDWRMKRPLDTPAQFTTINPMLHTLVYLDTSGRIDPAEADVPASVLGLDAPAAVIEFECAAERVKLTLGAREPFGDRYFFRAERDGQEVGVFRMSEYEYKSFTVSWPEFEDKRLIPEPFNPNAVTGVTLKLKRVVIDGVSGSREVTFETVRFELDAATRSIRIVEPEDLRDATVNSDVVGMLLYQLNALTAQEKAEYDETTPAKWGFDSPALEVEVRFHPAAGAQDLHFIFGKTGEGETEAVYGVCRPYDRVGLLDVKSFEGLPQSLDGESGYRSKDLYDLSWDVRRIQIEDRRSKRTLVVDRSADRRSETPWTVTEPAGLDYDPEGLGSVFSGPFFTTAKIEQFVERGPTNLSQYWAGGEPDVVLTFTIQGKSGSETRVFKFGRPSPMHVHAYVQHDRNAEIVAIAPGYLDELKKLWLNFIKRRIFDVDLDKLDRLIVEAPRVPHQNPFSYAVKPLADRTWMWDADAAPRPEHTIYQVAARELGSYFYDLNIEGFVAWDVENQAVYNLSEDKFHFRVTVAYRDAAGAPKERRLRVAYGSGPNWKKVFLMFEDDGIICAVNERLYDLLASQLRRR